MGPHALRWLLSLICICALPSETWAKDTDDVAKRLGFVVGLGTFAVQGTVIENVIPRGPAEAAGLRSGDVMFALDDQMAQGSAAFQAAIRAHCGQRVRIRVYRQDRSGAAIDVPVRLAATMPCLGVQHHTTTVQVPAVQSILAPSVASVAGLLAGDSILRIDKASGSQWVFTAEGVEHALQEYGRDAYVDGRMNLLVHRNGRSQNVLITAPETVDSTFGLTRPLPAAGGSDLSTRMIEQELRASPDDWSSWVTAWHNLGCARIESLARDILFRDNRVPAVKFALAMAMSCDDERTVTHGRDALQISSAVLAIRPEPAYAHATFLLAALYGDADIARQAAAWFFVHADPTSDRLAEMIGGPPGSVWTVNSRADVLFEAVAQGIGEPFSQLLYERARSLDRQMATRFSDVTRDPSLIGAERTRRGLADLRTDVNVLTTRVDLLEEQTRQTRRLLRETMDRVLATEISQRETANRLDRIFDGQLQLTRDEQQLKIRVDRLYGWFDSEEGQSTLGAVGAIPSRTSSGLLNFLSKYFYFGLPALGKIEFSVFPIIADVVNWLIGQQ